MRITGKGFLLRYARKAPRTPDGRPIAGKSVPLVSLKMATLKEAIADPSKYSGFFGLEGKHLKPFLDRVDSFVSRTSSMGKERIIPFDLPDGKVIFFRVRVDNPKEPSKVYLRQVPARHTITGKIHRGLKDFVDTYDSLHSILKSGFTSSFGRRNCKIEGKYLSLRTLSSGKHTDGDRYILEFASPVVKVLGSGDYHLGNQPLRSISRVIVEIAPRLPESSAAERKARYKKELAGYGIPLLFRKGEEKVEYS